MQDQNQPLIQAEQQQHFHPQPQQPQFQPQAYNPQQFYAPQPNNNFGQQQMYNPQQPPPVVYVQEQPIQYQNDPQVKENQANQTAMLLLILGIFIPLIGLINFILHFSSPYPTARKYGRISGLIICIKICVGVCCGLIPGLIAIIIRIALTAAAIPKPQQ